MEKYFIHKWLFATNCVAVYIRNQTTMIFSHINELDLGIFETSEQGKVSILCTSLLRVNSDASPMGILLNLSYPVY